MPEWKLLHLDDVNESEEMLWLREMDDAARERAGKTAQPLRRRQRIAGDHLVRLAVSKLTGKEPSQVKLSRLPSGKPETEGCFISLSHSGALVTAAAGGSPLGVDAERIRPYDARIPSRFFTPQEQAKLASAEDPLACFWQIWTGKEALVKLSGEGLAGLKRADTCALPVGVTLRWQQERDYLIALAEKDPACD